MMNHVRSALFPNPRPHHLAAAPQQLAAAASFHSTPVLQRKRKTQWHHCYVRNFWIKLTNYIGLMRTVVVKLLRILKDELLKFEAWVRGLLFSQFVYPTCIVLCSLTSFVFMGRLTDGLQYMWFLIANHLNRGNTNRVFLSLWQRFNYYAKRRRNRESKRSMLRNMSEYAEHLFQSWCEEDEKADTSSGPSWFRGHRWVRNSNNNGFRPHDFYYGNFKSKGGFEFCTSDEDEPETVFRNAFRHQHTYYWSFSSDDFQWRNSRRARSGNYRNWSDDTDDEDEVSAPSEISLARQALGLSASDPLKLEDVKKAYRVCALRWHPDRHNGSSKALAEEKFKHCSAAYKTLCDSLATA